MSVLLCVPRLSLCLSPRLFPVCPFCSLSVPLSVPFPSPLPSPVCPLGCLSVCPLGCLSVCPPVRSRCRRSCPAASPRLCAVRAAPGAAGPSPVFVCSRNWQRLRPGGVTGGSLPGPGADVRPWPLAGGPGVPRDAVSPPHPVTVPDFGGTQAPRVRHRAFGGGRVGDKTEPGTSRSIGGAAGTGNMESARLCLLCLLGSGLILLGTPEPAAEPTLSLPGHGREEPELCEPREPCAVRRGARFGKLCSCPRGSSCNLLILKCS
ncbi:uncharacterized protein LOC121361739 isoform X2 [Pyrgilauda ruficollis]|uniref:uncharacterized protein LOC121361739 isoform X2 n=1 Tax=Pyrgilauda ruficollis TaxID=221976 RepID=UPI001B886640|nr:uncharacterized protein LOC121361739 isoform X2 [Pyrgilauda ruficollis]